MARMCAPRFRRVAPPSSTKRVCDVLVQFPHLETSAAEPFAGKATLAVSTAAAAAAGALARRQRGGDSPGTHFVTDSIFSPVCETVTIDACVLLVRSGSARPAAAEQRYLRRARPRRWPYCGRRLGRLLCWCVACWLERVPALRCQTYACARAHARRALDSRDGSARCCLLAAATTIAATTAIAAIPPGGVTHFSADHLYAARLALDKKFNK